MNPPNAATAGLSGRLPGSIAHWRFSWLVGFAVVVALLVAAPLASVAWNVFEPSEQGVFAHLAETVLADYLINTLILMVAVTSGVILFGVSAAWLVTMHRFPGSRVFAWALVLPMAMPAYVVAYAYTDFLQFTGPLQTGLRETFGWSRGDYWFPEIRSVWGAAAMFTFVLYPYVYVIARAAFVERAGSALEAARTLGAGYPAAFFRVALPLARPAVAAGATLAVMETLADFGTVSYFAVETFTTGIYRAWFAFGDRVAAAQLSAMLLAFVAIAVTLERLSRGRARYHDTGARRSGGASRLSTGKGVVAALWCAVPLALGFLVPAAVLLKLARSAGDEGLGERYLGLIANSFSLAGGTAVAAAMVALLLAYAARIRPGVATAFLNRAVSLGYATPGSVIAVGILIPVTLFDNWLVDQAQARLGLTLGLVFTGGVLALVYAYVVRFLSIALQTVEASLAKITHAMDDVARSLGAGQLALLLRVHAPIVWPSLVTAAMLVFVDVMKELPATLVMRPFNFDTLATQVYTLAADERLAEAATPALTIVAVGLIPVIVLSRTIARSRK